MQRQTFTSLLILFLSFPLCYGQKNNPFKQQITPLKDSINIIQIKTDTLFKSNQIINLLVLDKEYFNKFKIQFSHNNLELKTTSSFAKSKNALAGINGGFFNMDDGGSVTYFEVNDTVISRKRSDELKWAVTDSLMNGAIVLEKDFDIILQPANSEQYYETSKKEAAVLITGPLLLLNSKETKLPLMEFVKKRHPRTCLCETKESIIFITIDGRNEHAEGMNLYETQKFLQNLGCVDAINLDGGGSTTMWTQNKGIINNPSDINGERPVSNVLLITKKTKFNKK
ncbi:phosphodiester glycosidase family protein [Polaribacter sp. MSW13]|uniref:Phosphodiester glycosidase family protein n=1 Tax=Polaribacter marinus TaxID=2916838 RepID=A0A9X2AIF7_9FLAO|nr:phosphodiester glycosidase family protein [Polaribacter marinus]MCI2228042.1 phosphodiester glycosidase family protein [Polaribacter marinus]